MCRQRAGSVQAACISTRIIAVPTAAQWMTSNIVRKAANYYPVFSKSSFLVAAEVHLGWKMVHHRLWSTKLVRHVVSEKRCGNWTIDCPWAFPCIGVFHLLGADRNLVRPRRRCACCTNRCEILQRHTRLIIGGLWWHKLPAGFLQDLNLLEYCAL